MRHIVLLCAFGMSTSLLATRMKEAAEAEGYEVEISARSVSEAEKAAQDADILLLGPQVKFKLPTIRSKVGCAIEAIDTRAYGRMDGKAVIDSVRKALGD